MIKKFNVTVNGNVYEVEVEEVASGVAPAIPVSPKVAPTPTPKAAPAPKATPVPAGANTVVAPMPGTILDVRVTTGTSVKQGDVLVVLEAMKMENEILAPADGIVGTVNVTKGASVNTGDVLVTM